MLDFFFGVIFFFIAFAMGLSAGSWEHEQRDKEEWRDDVLEQLQNALDERNKK